MARTLHALGADVLLMGLAGGDTGDVVEAALRRAGVPAALIPISGETRHTFTIVDGAGTAASFNEAGPRSPRGSSIRSAWHIRRPWPRRKRWRSPAACPPGCR